MSDPDDFLPALGFVPSYVYCFLAVDGEVLYIGCTRSLDRRVTKHRSTYAEEWHLVARMTVEVYADRYVAENAERVAPSCARSRGGIKPRHTHRLGFQTLPS